MHPLFEVRAQELRTLHAGAVSTVARTPTLVGEGIECRVQLNLASTAPPGRYDSLHEQSRATAPEEPAFPAHSALEAHLTRDRGDSPTAPPPPYPTRRPEQCGELASDQGGPLP